MVERMPQGNGYQSPASHEIRTSPMGQESHLAPADEGDVVPERPGRRLKPTAPIRQKIDAPSTPGDLQESTVNQQQEEPTKTYVARLVRRGIAGGVLLGAGGALLAVGFGLTAPVSVMLVAGSAMLGAMLFPILSSGNA